ncbi:MAG: gene transfer agent family protein [Devosia nanyangense]|uniref:Gene transfer agent family protein n=1 Tax=Devosia nanyangense TaxID=1228055 RepID=A0A933L3M6_9HYPH|nr:gene transfer agent family protein [Devosia nanyangense]
MANAQRGEIAAIIDGEEKTLCLTLGALAELEARLMAGDLVGLSERFATGRVSARDLTAILGAGLRGGGNAITDDDLARMAIEGGLKGAAEIAARLLRATFGGAP